MDYTKTDMRKFFAEKATAYDIGLRAYFVAIYKYMALALGITGLVAWLVASSTQLMAVLFGTPLAWVIVFAPVAMAFFMGSRLMEMSNEAARMSLWVFAVLIGLSLSTLFLRYTGESIARVFFITASLFGAMSIYGYTTRRDLSTLASFFMMGLIGVMIASIVNLFLQSSAVAFTVSIIAVLVFTFFTAFDTQRIKGLYYSVASSDTKVLSNVAIFGAVSLYMNFINLFITLLQLMGNRK